MSLPSSPLSAILDLEEPRLAAGIRITSAGSSTDGLVDLEHLAGDRRVDVGGGLDRSRPRQRLRSSSGCGRPSGSFHEHDVAELATARSR